jgi:acyl transferase domain-containing protein/acyl carrier protein
MAVVVRDGVAYAPGLGAAATGVRLAEVRVRPDATYLVTGGGGGLGRHIVRWLESQGARHIAVTSRGTVPNESFPGSSVQVFRADITSDTQLRELAATLAVRMPPLAGIVHAAGVNETERLERQSEERFRQIVATKLLGSLLLQRHFASSSLDFFLGISSIAGMWGASRMQAYSAASQFQNQLCRSRLFPTAQYCISYGPWDNTGMVDAEVGQQLQRQALRMLSVNEGIQALEQALNRGGVPLIAVAADWPRFVELLALPAAQRFFESLMPVQAKSPPVVPAQAVCGLLGLSEIRAVAAATLGRSADDFDVEAPLHALGMDSILALEFQRALQARTEVSLPRTLIFDHPTVSAIHRHIASSASPALRVAAVRTGERLGDIAILGASLRAPGASNIEQLWDLLDLGQDAIGRQIGSELAARAGRASQSLPPCPAYHAGLLDGVELFDAERFNLSRREAELMDPQQRLMLEAAWHAFEHAGYAPHELSGERCGVFVGTGNFDYREICREHAKNDGVGLIATSNVSSVIPGRIAYFFDLKGPSLSVDTACSSSLVALHLACLSLRAGESSMALVGGVNLLLSPDNHLTLHESKMLSVSGVCSAFDAQADGYVRSEAAGFVLLKPLELALSDGDRVLGVIRGSAINQDGRSSSLTAPNGASQREVMRAALAMARVTPGQVHVVEAHGTGTSLGDPIELQSIDAVYGNRDPDAPPLHVSAVKANVGHAEAASGIVSICKALGVLARRRLPKQIHYSRANPNARIESTRVQVADHPVSFPGGGALRIGISSFGFSGTNAHVILESPPEDAAGEPETRQGLGLFLLSASSELALGRLRRQYHDYFDSLDDASIAAVLARDAHAHRGGTWRVAARYSRRAELLRELTGAEPINAPLEPRALRIRLPELLSQDLSKQLERLRVYPELWPHFAELAGQLECDVAGYARALKRGLQSLGVAASFVECDADVVSSSNVLADFERAVVAAHLSGQNLAYEALFVDAGRRRSALPASTFDRKRFWICDAPEAEGTTAGALHQLVWLESERRAADIGRPELGEGVALIVGNTREQSEELALQGREAGIVPFIVLLSDAPTTSSDDVIVTSDLTAGVAEALARVRLRGLPLRRMLFAFHDPHPLRTDSSESEMAASTRAAHSLVQLVQTAVTSELAKVPLWVVTRRAQSVVDSDQDVDVAAAMLWGIVNVVRCEYPEFSVACLDLDERRAERIWHEVLGGEPRSHVAWRGGKRYVPEIQPWSATSDARSLAISSAASYLVAGGLGGIGLEIVQWLLQQGARHVVVLGRRPAGARERELEVLRQRYSANIISIAVDIVNRAELARCLAELAPLIPPFGGVIQAAGLLDDRLICNTTAESFVGPVAVKARGTLNLHWVTRDAHLDFFACLSSTTAFLGNVGQVSHAAASAALDAVVTNLRREGVSAQSIAWGPWRDVGQAASSPAHYFQAFGIEPFATAQGLQCLARALTERSAHVLAIRVDWERFQAHRGVPLAYRLSGAPRAPLEPAEQDALLPLPARDRGDVLTTTRRLVADVLKLDIATASDTQPFHSLGVDSAMAVQLGVRLAEVFRCSFNSTVIFDYPNVEKLASYISGIYQRRASEATKHHPVAEKLQCELDEIAVWLEQ